MNIPSITAFANFIKNEEEAIQMLVDNGVIKKVGPSGFVVLLLFEGV